MENAFFNWLASLGLSPLNTVLLVVIAWLARQRIMGIISDVKACDKRQDRIEKSLIAVGIPLIKLDEV